MVGRTTRHTFAMSSWFQVTLQILHAKKFGMGLYCVVLINQTASNG